MFIALFFGVIGVLCLAFPRKVTGYQVRQHSRGMKRAKNPVYKFMLGQSRPSFLRTLYFGGVFTAFAAFLFWIAWRAFATGRHS